MNEKGGDVLVPEKVVGKSEDEVFVPDGRWHQDIKTVERSMEVTYCRDLVLATVVIERFANPTRTSPYVTCTMLAPRSSEGDVFQSGYQIKWTEKGEVKLHDFVGSVTCKYDESIGTYGFNWHHDAKTDSNRQEILDFLSAVAPIVNNSIDDTSLQAVSIEVNTFREALAKFAKDVAENWKE